MSVVSIRVDVFEKMKHAIGFKQKSVKNGKYEAYRNHFISAPCGDRDLESLVNMEFAIKYQSELLSGVEYQITRKGLDFMESVLSIKIQLGD